MARAADSTPAPICNRVPEPFFLFERAIGTSLPAVGRGCSTPPCREPAGVVLSVSGKHATTPRASGRRAAPDGTTSRGRPVRRMKCLAPRGGGYFKTCNGLPHAGRAASRLEMASPARGAPFQGLKPFAPSGGAASRPETAFPASPVASEGPLGTADVKCASRAEADFSASAAPGTLRTLNARHPERRRIGPILVDCRNGLATRLTIPR